MPQRETKEDHQWQPDHEESPAGDFRDLRVVHFLGIGRGVVEFSEEMHRQIEIEHRADQKGCREKQGALPEQFAIGYLLLLFGNCFFDHRNIEHRIIVEKGIEQRAFAAEGEQHCESENERDAGFFDAKKQGRIGLDGAIFVPQIERQSTRQQHRYQAQQRKGIHLFRFDEKPDAVGEGRYEREDHRLRCTDVPDFIAILAHETKSHHRDQHVDEDVVEGIFLFCFLRRHGVIG